jgi:hypothetical protein
MSASNSGPAAAGAGAGAGAGAAAGANREPRRKLQFANAIVRPFQFNAPAVLKAGPNYHERIPNEDEALGYLAEDLGPRSKEKKSALIAKLAGAQSRTRNTLANAKLANRYQGIASMYTVLPEATRFVPGRAGLVTSANVGTGRYGAVPYAIRAGNSRHSFFDEISQVRRARVSLMSDQELLAELRNNGISTEDILLRDDAVNAFLSMPPTQEEDEQLVKVSNDIWHSRYAGENERELVGPMASRIRGFANARVARQIAENIEHPEVAAAIAQAAAQAAQASQAAASGNGNNNNSDPNSPRAIRRALKQLATRSASKPGGGYRKHSTHKKTRKHKKK